MKKYLAICYIALLTYVISAQTQDTLKMDTPRAFLPEGYELVKTDAGEEIAYADLNGDSLLDVATLIRKHSENEEYDFSDEVHLAIFLKDAQGNYRLSAQSLNLGGESIRYSSEKKLSVKKNVISYLHQSMRHHIEVKFRYEKKHQDFMLIGKEYSNYGSGSMEGVARKSINYLTGLSITVKTKIDEEKEEMVELPPQKARFSKALKPLSVLDEDGLYEDI